MSQSDGSDGTLPIAKTTLAKMLDTIWTVAVISPSGHSTAAEANWEQIQIKHRIATDSF
jgi:hypothetical protein